MQKSVYVLPLLPLVPPSLSISLLVMVTTVTRESSSGRLFSFRLAFLKINRYLPFFLQDTPWDSRAGWWKHVLVGNV